MGISARECALRALINIAKNGAYSDKAVDAALSGTSFDARDRALVTNIVYGTVSNRLLLDYRIQNASKIKIKKMDTAVREILRSAVYQIFLLEKIPDSAAVNEAVKLAKKYASRSVGFINAVLRGVIAAGEILPDKNDVTAYLSIKYSYPEWMVRKWLDELGAEQCEQLLNAGNQNPPVTVRVNSLKTDSDNLCNIMDFTKTEVDGALVSTQKGSLADCDEFKNGLYSIQDTASQLAVLTLSPEAGDRVLDVCAAPGGKTTHMAELMQNEGEIIAWDIYEHKTDIIKKAADRLGITIIKPELHNAKDLVPEYKESFDKVLVDAPCSGLGIIRKKPDIKWQRTEESIQSLAGEQKEILETACTYVKKGGQLLYSTCTITPEENMDRVNEFISTHKDFELLSAKTLYPHKDGTDGFFISLLKRR
ncbi:MAG: 16S rRNA (cytosine(967)-C(5))-methyltransferase RsmB [Clostridia bacterium]|nr:16S rRNA (cytosine(967)-C(5))-methyltransferase RsmB [Clostridia bacterium]